MTTIKITSMSSVTSSTNEDEVFLSPPVSCSSSCFSEQFVCRICQMGNRNESMISPCNCKGSVGLVHRTCLEKWLSRSNTDSCEICKFRFAISRRPKSFIEWLNQSEVLTDRRHFFIDVICFLMLGPLTITSAWLCTRGAIHYLREQVYGCWEAFGLMTLAFVLIVVFICWSYMSLRYHWRVWQMWRYSNFNIHLDSDRGSRLLSSVSTGNLITSQKEQMSGNSSS